MAGSAIAGMGALVVRYYQTDNSTEKSILKDVMTKGIEVSGEAREDLAERIINALGRALDKKGKKGGK